MKTSGAENLRIRNKGAPWALVDQAIVSGCNFLTNLLVVRHLGIEQYGSFVTFNALLLYIWTWQLALFISPMMTLAPQIEDANERESFARGSVTLQFLFAGPAAAVLVSGLRLSGTTLRVAVAVGAATLLFQLQ
ncbi:MAG TPA: hypothetical protein VD837_03640, partial [Terriglobales bacterium]|nr:hypothetical protein [Terriglobales bacterium]